MPATPAPTSQRSTLQQTRLYLGRQASSPARYVLEQSLQALAGGLPTLAGIGVRAVLYRLMLRMDGTAAIERNVRLRYASLIRLGQGSYLDEGPASAFSFRLTAKFSICDFTFSWAP